MPKYFGGGGGGGGGGVTSVFGRVGAVVAALGDYGSSLITNQSTVAGSTVTNALNTLAAVISSLVTGVSSVFGRVGAVTAQSGDYNAGQISTSGGSNSQAALNSLGPSDIYGSALTDANQTLTPTGVSRYNCIDATLTAVRNKTFDPAGFTASQAVRINGGSQTQNMTITNGGPSGPTVIFTFPGDSVKRYVVLMKDSSGNIYVDRSGFTGALVQ